MKTPKAILLFFLSVCFQIDANSQTIPECKLSNFEDIYPKESVDLIKEACQNVESGKYSYAFELLKKAAEIDSLANANVGYELSTLISAVSAKIPQSLKEDTNKVATIAIKDIKDIKESSDFTLSESQLEDFKLKGIQKIKLLESYLAQIGSQSVETQAALMAQENAQSLFVNPDSNIVQVTSSKSNSTKNLKVRRYLERLRLLNYDNVSIEWVDLTFASNFLRGGDGNYYGYAIFQQRFRGEALDGKTYEDITTKRIQVVVKAFDQIIEGQKVQGWDVFLGDISVVQKI